MKNSFRSKIKSSIWAFFFMALGMASVWFILNSIDYGKIQNLQNSANVGEIANTDNQPSQAFYFLKDPKKKPIVSAEAYYVGDLDTGEVIVAKNENAKFPIASVSKLMTALVSLQDENQESTVQISKDVLATEGENGNFHLNEQIKVSDLLYPLLLESSNDAAEAIAAGYGRDKFMEDMNKKAQELGMASTSFVNPSGLSEHNVSTTLDLFKLSKYLKENKPDILNITLNKSFSNKKHFWFSNNQFLKTPGYLGGKSGYINQAKQTVVSLFNLPLSSTGARNIGITILRSPDRKKDVENILSYLNKNVFYGTESDANMAWFKQKDGVLEEKQPNFLTLLFGGDIMLDRGVKSSVMKNFGGDYSKLFDNLDILKSSDIAFANLEGTASDKGSDIHNLYSFRMDQSVIPALKGAGISILSVANNHVGDWGREAYSDTLERLKENEISYTGGGMNVQEAEAPTIVEKYGMKIGFLGFSDKGPDWMQATSEEAGPLMASNPRFDEIVQNASKQVDFLVVSFHFGEEYQAKHNARQEYLAHRAIDDGAKIIIGHHPHVVEDTEVYKNGFIAYSLGNFIFDQMFSSDTMQGMLLGITIGRDGSMSVNKNIVKLNSVFQPEKVIKGKEEKVKFSTVNLPR